MTLTDSKSGLTNSAVTFSVVFGIVNASSITVNTTPSAQTYTIGATALQVNVPTYTWLPTVSTVSWSYAIQSGPSFVTIVGTKINIDTSDVSKVGNYTVTIRTTETNSALLNEQTFTLQVKCVTAIAPTTLANVVYYLNDAAI